MTTTASTAQNQKHTPRVSVLMGVYNAERYVGAAIESILQQTFADFEYIIIDDGSTDNSLEIIREFAHRDARIQLHHRENRGIGATRNELLSLARGEFVATMDADDIATRERLDIQVAFLDEHPGHNCVGGNYELIDDEDRHLIMHDRQPLDDVEVQEQMLRGITSINNPTVMMRRSDVVAVGGYDPELAPAEDLDLYLKLGERGKLANVPQIVLRYRELGTSASATSHSAQLERMRIATERAWKRRGIDDGIFEAKPWRATTPAELHGKWIKYGWWGFVRGDQQHARAYGVKAVKLKPWAWQGWSLLFAAYFKSPPTKKST